jgi:tetratricopeptide (TPR) repeat protein
LANPECAADVFNNKGNAFYAMGKYFKAIRAYGKAILLN